MNTSKNRATAKELIFDIAAVLLIFQIYLQEYISIVRYIDEIVAVGCLLFIFVVVLRGRMEKSQIYMALPMVLVLFIGLIGNFYAGAQTAALPIVTDVGNTFKVFVTYIGSSLLLRTINDKSRIIRWLAFWVRGLVLVMFVCMVLHEAGIYTMGEDVRYGLKSFMFLCNGAGNLSMTFYGIVLVLTLDLKINPKKKTSRLIMICLALVIWVSTLRTRAMMYSLMYVVLLWLLAARNKKLELNWKTLLLVVIFLLVFSLDQIEVYFGSDSTPRAKLLQYGFHTMARFFPFGSGFATYGTDAALVYYSNLYYEYGFHKLWGLSPEYAMFAHDTYWPAIFAQFGFFGGTLMIAVVWRWCKDLIDHCKKNKYSYCIALFFVITQVSSSIATATFFNFVTVGAFFLIPLAFDGGDTNNERRKLHEESDSFYPNL